MGIEIRDVSKRFGSFTVLSDLSLRIPSGKLIALLGPSGCGKTTLLRIIAGLEYPDSGSILFQGEDATQWKARDRRVGFVFQHYALFEHMTVSENVAFGLRVKPRRIRPGKIEIKERVGQLLKLVHMEELASRYPCQLSGGQRQRIALARALAVEPAVLLLDEPFGALDAKVRKELRRWLRRLHDEIQTTSVFVTHDQEEALELADTVVVMNEGRIVQSGSPQEVYDKPASSFVYDFLGSVNMFQGKVVDEKVFIGSTEVQAQDAVDRRDDTAVVCFRPHLLDLCDQESSQSLFKARVTYLHMAGPLVKVELEDDTGKAIHVELTQERYQRLRFHEGSLLFVEAKVLESSKM